MGYMGILLYIAHSHILSTWGGPYKLGGPYIKDYSILGFILGSPRFGKRLPRVDPGFGVLRF